jgi:hypothetical protein
MSIAKRRIQILVIISLSFLEIWACVALKSPFQTRAKQYRSRDLLVRRAAATEQDVLGGVTEFEEWFTSLPDAFCRPAIQHKAFGMAALRGLTFTDSHEITKLTPVVAVPREFILKASYFEPDWDLQLAQQLWDECQKGQKSQLYG